MRGLAALTAAAAAWMLVGAPVPGTLRRPAGWRLPAVPARTWLAAAATWLVVATLALGLTAAPLVALVVGLLAAAVPFATNAARAARRRAAVAARWPDLLASVRSHLASGSALPDAFVASAVRAGPELAAAGRHVEEARLAGRPFPDALTDLRERFADPVADRILITLAESHLAGGRRVGTILASLATSVADELRLRKAHEAALTQQRLTATVALVAPWALLVLTVTTNPQAADAYRTASGTLVVAAGAAATAGGYLLARRAARLSKPPRLFA